MPPTRAWPAGACRTGPPGHASERWRRYSAGHHGAPRSCSAANVPDSPAWLERKWLKRSMAEVTTVRFEDGHRRANRAHGRQRGSTKCSAGGRWMFERPLPHRPARRECRKPGDQQRAQEEVTHVILLSLNPAYTGTYDCLGHGDGGQPYERVNPAKVATLTFRMNSVLIAVTNIIDSHKSAQRLVPSPALPRQNDIGTERNRGDHGREVRGERNIAHSRCRGSEPSSHRRSA